MEEIHQKILITYRWKTKGKKNPIPPNHLNALKETAEQKITQHLLKGHSHGEMEHHLPQYPDNFLDTQQKPIEYKGWFQISKTTKHHQTKQKQKPNKSSRSSIG